MPACTFDNPDTMARECWQDGRLVAVYGAETIQHITAWPPPAEVFHMGANIGPWKKGQLIGDREAMQAKPDP